METKTKLLVNSQQHLTTLTIFFLETVPSGEDCSITQIVSNKEDCASIPENSTNIEKQIANCGQQKLQQFHLFEETARSKVSEENSAINEASPKEI